MLEYIAKQLLEKETLDEKEFEKLMRDVRIERGEDVPPLEDEQTEEINTESEDSANEENQEENSSESTEE